MLSSRALRPQSRDLFRCAMGRSALCLYAYIYRIIDIMHSCPLRSRIALYPAMRHARWCRWSSPHTKHTHARVPSQHPLGSLFIYEQINISTIFRCIKLADHFHDLHQESIVIIHKLTQENTVYMQAVLIVSILDYEVVVVVGKRERGTGVSSMALAN